MKFIGIDTDEKGIVYMFQGKHIWMDFRLTEDGVFTLVDSGVCSDWSHVE